MWPRLTPTPFFQVLLPQMPPSVTNTHDTKKFKVEIEKLSIEYINEKQNFLSPFFGRGDQKNN